MFGKGYRLVSIGGANAEGESRSRLVNSAKELEKVAVARPQIGQGGDITESNR